MSQTQTCRKCHQEKNASEFRPKRSGEGLMTICNSCRQQVYLPGSVVPTIVKAGYLYLIRAENGKVKIGVADNPARRLRNISMMSPVPLQMILSVWSENVLILEAEIHRMFTGFHSHGEWFNLSESQIKEAIEYASKKCTVVSP